MNRIEMRHAVLTQRLQSCTIKYNEKAILMAIIIGIAAIIFTLFSIRSTLPEREITSSVF